MREFEEKKLSSSKHLHEKFLANRINFSDRNLRLFLNDTMEASLVWILIQHQRKLNDRQGKSVLEEGRPPIGEKNDCKFDAYRNVI